MPDRWRETRVRKVLRPAISIQVFLVSLCLLSKCWDGSPVSKLSLHASHVALPKYILISERLHVFCIRVINLCHRVPTQLQLNKYYYYYYYYYPVVVVGRETVSGNVAHSAVVITYLEYVNLIFV